MKLRVEVQINASKEAIWNVITNIENSPNVVAGIDKIEVLEKPKKGIVGLKWRETRTMFGKTATEVMWITDAIENESYKTRAESHGSVYVTTLSIVKLHDGAKLAMEFEGIPQTVGAKLMWTLTGFIFKNATKKALMQDLLDIKAAVEN
ncbi:SRPBCC family protein [candidate division KSB1 bacterium]|nr:SRPBCC family protein [candidate division KSB1 bacterium]